jgi:hypothetical protein
VATSDKKIDPISAKDFGGSGQDSDETSGDDFIEIERVKKNRTTRKKFHSSALNLSSDVDSLYDSSSGGNVNGKST